MLLTILVYRYHDSSGKVTRKNHGQCTYKCSTKHYSSCRTKASCEGLKGHQWLPSTCCGVGCSTPGKNQENGSCQRPCSISTPYQCALFGRVYTLEVVHYPCHNKGQCHK